MREKQVRDKDHQNVILEVRDLFISYETRKGDVPAVRGISFEVHRGEIVGLVGESGCGKSTVAFGIVDFLGPNGKIIGGSIRFQGMELIGRSQDELRRLRGNQITMVYQDPMQALNPSLRIGEQIAEAIIFHKKMAKKEACDRSIEMLKRVNMPDPANVMDRYPHQISGGQQQRVIIAMALINNPALLIMDEPTTALDVTVEAAVLDLVKNLKEDFDAGIIYITHNLGVMARVSDYLSVMYAGEIVEQGTTLEIFDNPLHPYTQGLMRCLPKLGFKKASTILYPIRSHVPPPAERPNNVCIYAPRCDYARDKCLSARPEFQEITDGHRVLCFYAKEIDRHAWTPTSDIRNKFHSFEATAKANRDSVLKVVNLKAYYQQESKSVIGLLGLEKKSYVKAVDGVDFKLLRQNTLGIVGESGCGKTTLVKAIIGLEKVNSGIVEFLGFNITSPLRDRDLKFIKEMQMVFQNPDSTLNPSYSIGKQIARPLKKFKIVPKDRIRSQVIELLRAVRLDVSYYERLPRQLSGGEKQRVGIARAIASHPQLVICDEPVSALDVSVQAAILNLLMEIQNDFTTTMIIISHDLSVVSYLSDYVAVMYMGQIVEFGRAEAIYSPPYHPYTESLLSAVPIPDPKAEQKYIRLSGTVPSALNPPNGCRFHTRCPRRTILPYGGIICEREDPPYREGENEHRILCHIPLKELNKIESLC